MGKKTISRDRLNSSANYSAFRFIFKYIKCNPESFCRLRFDFLWRSDIAVVPFDQEEEDFNLLTIGFSYFLCCLFLWFWLFRYRKLIDCELVLPWGVTQTE